MISNQEVSDIVTGSPSNTKEVTDYIYILGINPNPMVLLIWLEKLMGNLYQSPC